MIYGILPVGGEGKRLGLPYPKGLLPIKGLDHYQPIINCSVKYMLQAGAEIIIFTHDKQFKRQIKEYFNGDKYIHLLNPSQRSVNFCKSLLVPIQNGIGIQGDVFLFGLPDTLFDYNVYLQMKDIEGIVCGVFLAQDDELKVDRMQNGQFKVKSTFIQSNSKLFWGCLKFDYIDIISYKEKLERNNLKDVGYVLNKLNFTCIKTDSEYIDLGTWKDVNYYYQGATRI